MFGSNKDDNQQRSTDMDDVAKEIDNGSTGMGIGHNPSSYNPVMPSQAQSAPPMDNSSSDDSSTPAAPSTPAPSGLDEIKNQALQQLSPLVGKLEQEPEDRFKTLMMMIQASDNHDLIKDAYEAANAINDETAKAQALLAIVNEINYFTQKHA
jgi:hypothetical protein